MELLAWVVELGLLARLLVHLLQVLAKVGHLLLLAHVLCGRRLELQVLVVADHRVVVLLLLLLLLLVLLVNLVQVRRADRDRARCNRGRRLVVVVVVVVLVELHLVARLFRFYMSASSRSLGQRSLSFPPSPLSLLSLSFPSPTAPALGRPLASYPACTCCRSLALGNLLGLAGRPAGFP